MALAHQRRAARSQQGEEHTSFVEMTGTLPDIQSVGNDSQEMQSLDADQQHQFMPAPAFTPQFIPKDQMLPPTYGAMNQPLDLLMGGNNAMLQIIQTLVHSLERLDNNVETLFCRIDGKCVTNFYLHAEAFA